MTNAKPKAVPLAITIREAQELLGKSETYIRARIADGTLKATKAGRSVILSRAQVLSLVPGVAREMEAAE